jgi:hypothetical protein
VLVFNGVDQLADCHVAVWPLSRRLGCDRRPLVCRAHEAQRYFSLVPL